MTRKYKILVALALVTTSIATSNASAQSFTPQTNFIPQTFEPGGGTTWRQAHGPVTRPQNRGGGGINVQQDYRGTGPNWGGTWRWVDNPVQPRVNRNYQISQQQMQQIQQSAQQFANAWRQMRQRNQQRNMQQQQRRFRRWR